MRFDVFHSLGRIDSVSPRLTDRRSFELFFEQAIAAENLGFGTVWAAESHFSSEVQKAHAEPVIPHYDGEVGLNADSMQLAHALFARTQRIGFGTAIMNIVGGNGGPIAAADRVRSLVWHNALLPVPRELAIGVAAGRFPYINKPFGIVPRDTIEVALWSQVQQLIFVEALEIFLRLQNGETFGSDDVTGLSIGRSLFRDDAAFGRACAAVPELARAPLPYKARWQFEPLKLVPELDKLAAAQAPRFVLGSSDPVARDHGLKFADLDIFNLSFTPPDAIERTHTEMFARYAALGRLWGRARMPRTVLIFIDKNPDAARARASQCFDTYIEAMRGTAAFPPKDTLMQRALIGDAAMIKEQLGPQDPHGFNPQDRLMLWFEFNQTDGDAIVQQMRQFAEQVMPHFV